MFPELEYKEHQGECGTTKEVSLFALSYCDHCHEAIAFLKAEGLSFRYLFLDAVPNAQRGHLLRELKRRTGNDLIFPVLITPEKLLKGFSKEVWRETLALPTG